jgi:hypothetical protein
MPARKTPAKKAVPSPLKGVKVRLLASLGETTIEANCTLDVAPDLGLLLHDALEQMVKRRPALGHIVSDLHGGAVDVSEAEYYEEGKRLGF